MVGTYMKTWIENKLERTVYKNIVVHKNGLYITIGFGGF